MMNTCLLCKEVQVFIIFEMKKMGLKQKKKWHGRSGEKFWQNFDYWKDEEKIEDQLGVPCKKPGEQ